VEGGKRRGGREGESWLVSRFTQNPASIMSRSDLSIRLRIVRVNLLVPDLPRYLSASDCARIRIRIPSPSPFPPSVHFPAAHAKFDAPATCTRGPISANTYTEVRWSWQSWPFAKIDSGMAREMLIRAAWQHRGRRLSHRNRMTRFPYGRLFGKIDSVRKIIIAITRSLFPVFNAFILLFSATFICEPNSAQRVNPF
jgi:hypothetical protein